MNLSRKEAALAMAALAALWLCGVSSAVFAYEIPGFAAAEAGAGGYAGSVTLPGGKQADIYTAAGAPAPALQANATFGTVTLADGTNLDYHKLGGTLTNGSDYAWWYGCSPTSAGMMVGYYDRNGYGGLGYTNLVRGGMAESSSYASAPLATAAIASPRHISDFYRAGYNATGDDLAGAPTGPLNCLADYMGTSQDAIGNVNGGTTFYDFTDGSRLYAKDAYNYGISDKDGMFGVYEYIKNYAGYNLGDPSTTTAAFSQYLQGHGSNPSLGFTWNDYKTEIDAGRPMLIQVSDPVIGGHTMIGYGYTDGGTPSTEQIILNDTWTPGPHSMIWGGVYGGMTEYGVMGLTLQGGETPEPSTFVLLMAAVAFGAIGYARRRRP